MAKVLLKCPGCGGEVELGDIECRHCGMNLKSGESYESQVKKAKGAVEHGERLVIPIFVGVVIVFAMLLFAGLMYQGRMETAIRDRADLLVPAIREFQKIDDLIYARDYDKARKRTKALITDLEKQADQIVPPDPYQKKTVRPWMKTRRVPKYNKAAVKRLLWTLRAKAERKLKEIPTA